MTKKKKAKEMSESLLRRYRRTRQQGEDDVLLEKILMLRNSGMKCHNIAHALRVSKSTVYNSTCAIPAYVRVQECMEVALAAKSLEMSVAEYLCLCHAQWGVGYCQKHGNSDWVKNMIAVANGGDVE
jgi:hypothetical protein